MIYVEGDTEETFVKEILFLYLEEREIYAEVSSIGRTIKYDLFVKDLKRLLGSSNYKVVTMMLDLYGIHPSFYPGDVT